MILRADRKPLIGRIETRPAGNGPAQQNAIELQPEIIMLACRPMMLDDEETAAALAPFLRFGSLGEIPFCLIGRERALSHDRRPSASGTGTRFCRAPAGRRLGSRAGSRT